MSRLKKIKEWLKDKPQFEIISSNNQGSFNKITIVKRTVDGVIFHSNDEVFLTQYGISIIRHFNSDFKKAVVCTNFGLIVGCEINDIDHARPEDYLNEKDFEAEYWKQFEDEQD